MCVTVLPLRTVLYSPTTVRLLIYVALSTAACEMLEIVVATNIYTNFEHDEWTTHTRRLRARR